MSFESKRLRVQLPCLEGESVKEVAADFTELQCPPGSFFCDPNTCVAGRNSQIGPGGVCPNFGTCRFGSCDFGTCGWQTPWVCPAGTRIPPQCPAGSEEPFQPGRIVIDVELLPVLKERLEAQLKEIEKAEKELKKRTG
jgi:hypothetical protein